VSEQEYLQAGVTAFKSGNRQKAASILSQLVKEYPRSERGWYLLGMCVSTTEQRQYCYRQVLKINPNNPDAKKQLALLSAPQPAPVSQAVPPLSSRDEPTLAATPSSEQSFRSAPPFISYEEQAAKENAIAEQKKALKQALEEKKKRDRRILIVSVFAGFVVLICASIAVFTMLNSSLRNPYLRLHHKFRSHPLLPCSPCQWLPAL
jgi:tetratricopeptide (TPR) repeat protein